MSTTDATPETGASTAGDDWVGKSLKRVEDPRLLRGRGRYVDDYVVPGMLEVGTLRSPLAHARIVSIDTSAAEKLPGVHAVLTGADAKELTEPLFRSVPDPIEQYCLAVDKVRYVGEYVAVVVAKDRYIAEDAAALIDVEYEELPPVVDPYKAMEEGAALVHEELGSNVPIQRTLTFGDVAADYAEADIIVEDSFRWGRHSGVPMETIGAVATYDASTGTMEIIHNLQSPLLNWAIAASLKVPTSRLKLIPRDIGGGFGIKFYAPKPAVIAGMASRVTKRPVKFMEDRFDHMMNCDGHAEDRYYEASLAAKQDGTLLSFKIKVMDDYGAYFQFGPGSHANTLSQATGLYTIRSLEYDMTAVLTNKCQQAPYRGFGTPPTNFVLERLIDKVAAQIGKDRVDIRRQNFIPKDAFPYTIPTGNEYDSGDYEKVLDALMEQSKYAELVEWAKEQRKNGRYVGVGISTTPDRSVFSATEFWFWYDDPPAPVSSSPESATIKIEADGTFTVFLHSASSGTAAETVATQVVATEFGVDPEKVAVHGIDWHSAAPATGPAGSRLTVMMTGALKGAADIVKEKILKIAAADLEAAPEDLEFGRGVIQVKGAPDLQVSLDDIAGKANAFKLQLPDDVGTGLLATFTYDHPRTTLPNKDRTDLGIFYPFMAQTMHVPVVEVDIETGEITFLDYFAVHDCGTMINPMTVDGQVLGASCQGIGGALLEDFRYDENGQMLSASFMDYLMPTAMEMPAMKVGHTETPSPFSYRGVKGAGEGGRMVVASALASALDDALQEFDIHITGLPLTPSDLLAQINEARARQEG
jgi:CO/xanthine dehydrogenase Mo-binding subunit